MKSPVEISVGGKRRKLKTEPYNTRTLRGWLKEEVRAKEKEKGNLVLVGKCKSGTIKE